MSLDIYGGQAMVFVKVESDQNQTDGSTSNNINGHIGFTGYIFRRAR